MIGNVRSSAEEGLVYVGFLSANWFCLVKANELHCSDYFVLTGKVKGSVEGSLAKKCILLCFLFLWEQMD